MIVNKQVKLDYNDHSYNQITAMTNEFKITFLSQITVFGYNDFTAITNIFWSCRVCYNQVLTLEGSKNALKTLKWYES